ncbi:MAG TPA: hypothetical protein V6D02_15945 [Candidatus Obscuribacterales bacterium]
MTALGDVFFRANDRCRQLAYQNWHQGQRKRQILRSQIGFVETAASRPAACAGCDHYHGHAYGHQRESRIPLICAMHPYGWEMPTPCPDWQGSAPLAEGSFTADIGPVLGQGLH